MKIKIGKFEDSTNKNYGMMVYITFTSGESEHLYNVTEIHYGCRGDWIAFKSSIYGADVTYDISNIKEFETKREKLIHGEF